MNLNLKVDSVEHVTIGTKKYPITIAGQGFPCIVIGTGTVVQRTLSARFKKKFKVYSSDLYFDKKYALSDFSRLTMEQMVEDIAQLGKQLNLSQYFLFGFSAFGIVALEFAKKYPEYTLGVIMVGTPINSNETIAAQNNAYFQLHADPERKKIDAERRAQLDQEDLAQLDFSSRFLREYTYGGAPRYWHQPDFDCSPAWKGITLDRSLEYLFTIIFPSIDVGKGLEKISCPIFLAWGKSDYDCCPFMWRTIANLPPKMEMHEFEKSGHWPHYEESKNFDQAIENWLKNIL